MHNICGTIMRHFTKIIYKLDNGKAALFPVISLTI